MLGIRGRKHLRYDIHKSTMNPVELHLRQFFLGNTSPRSITLVVVDHFSVLKVTTCILRPLKLFI